MFSLQPMLGKLIAPTLGSVPAVWTTCMLFFQGILLAGYLYAHLAARVGDLRKRVLLHGLITIAAFAALPPMIPEWIMAHVPSSGSPIPWLLLALAVTAGIPAFVLAASAPVLQSWFADTRHRLAADPYPLYSASNLGSIIGLASYPFLIEPNLGLAAQRSFWTVGYILYAVAVAIAGVCAIRMQSERAKRPHEDELERWTTSSADTSGSAAFDQPARFAERDTTDDPWSVDIDAFSERGVSNAERRMVQRLGWMCTAMVPTSLLLGVTTHITTDIAAMPLMWTMPLLAYLLSWILAFSTRGDGLHRAIIRISPMAAIAAAILYAAEFREAMGLVIGAHVLALFVLSWALHRGLFLKRPDNTRLTDFYLWIAIGGVVGGIFNAIIAPLVFSGIAEYGVALVAAMALTFFARRAIDQNSTQPSATQSSFGDSVAIAALGIAGSAAIAVLAHQSVTWQIWTFAGVAGFLGWTTEQVGKWVEFGLPMLPVLLLWQRQRTQVAAFALVLFLMAAIHPASSNIMRTRSFFGVLTVREYEDTYLLHSLVHGGILHGEQRMDTLTDRLEPRSYYHREGPLGDVIRNAEARKDRLRIAAIGLGTGSIAAYGQAEHHITFFEIDADVEKIARDTRYFTYLDDCIRRGCHVDVTLGDARRSLEQSRDLFDVIVVDAFSSDAIPLHLITREAIRVWFDRLELDGIVAFHVSNRYVDLLPVLANAAADAGIIALHRDDLGGDKDSGRGGSSWVVLTSDHDVAGALADLGTWVRPEKNQDIPVWTDDYASVWKVFRL